MQFITIALLAMVAGTLGLPPSANQDMDEYTTSSDLDLESAGPCGALVRKAVCCKKSLFSILDFGCHRPQGNIETGPELAAACSAKSKLPRCCLLGVLGTYVACKAPHSVAKELGYFNNTEDDIDPIAPGQYYDVDLL